MLLGEAQFDDIYLYPDTGIVIAGQSIFYDEVKCPIWNGGIDFVYSLRSGGCKTACIFNWVLFSDWLMIGNWKNNKN